MKNGLCPAFKNLKFPNYDLKFTDRTGICTIPSRAKTQVLSKSFLNSAIAHWNTIPQTIQNINNYSSFKRHLKDYTISEYRGQPHDRITNHSWDGFIIKHG